MDDKSIRSIDLLALFNSDANNIINSRIQGGALHRSGDIRACGDEIEDVVRGIIRNKIPKRFHLERGKIIDEKLNTSHELDFIISDSDHATVLFKSRNGLEYIPIETVLAYGEIKSSYNIKCVKEFLDKSERSFSCILKPPLPQGYIGRGIKISLNGLNFTQANKKQLIHRSMIFVNSDDLDTDELLRYMHDNDRKYLPCIIYFVDRGMVWYAGFERDGVNLGFRTAWNHPECIGSNVSARNFNTWTATFIDDKDQKGLSLFWYISSIHSHIINGFAHSPDLMMYAHSMSDGNLNHTLLEPT